MTEPADVLSRLRDSSPDGAADRLAALLVDEALDRPLRDVIDVAHAARAVREVVQALTASDGAAARITRDVERAIADVGADAGPLRARVPPALASGARAFLELPIAPQREAVLRLLDREPVRKLLRAQVIDTLIAFGKKAASPVSDSSLARGLGGLSKLAFGQLSSRPNPLGSIATAVSNEVEKQVERRAADFADTAVSGILEGIATQITDPSRAADQAAVRVALLEGALEITGAELAELGRPALGAQIAVARGALAAWASAPTFAADVEAALAKQLAPDMDRTLGELLGDLGLRDVAAAHAREVVRAWVGRVAAAPAFERWLRELLA
jgi:hypothetical protein